MESLAQPIDLGLGIKDFRLRGLVGRIEISLTGIGEHRFGFERDEGGRGGLTTALRGIQRILLPQHLAPHRGESGGRAVSLAGEL